MSQEENNLSVQYVKFKLNIEYLRTFLKSSRGLKANILSRAMRNNIFRKLKRGNQT